MDFSDRGYVFAGGADPVAAPLTEEDTSLSSPKLGFAAGKLPGEL